MKKHEIKRERAKKMTIAFECGETHSDGIGLCVEFW